MSINETLVDFNLRNVVGDFLIVSSMDHLKKTRQYCILLVINVIQTYLPAHKTLFFQTQ